MYAKNKKLHSVTYNMFQQFLAIVENILKDKSTESVTNVNVNYNDKITTYREFLWWKTFANFMNFWK